MAINTLMIALALALVLYVAVALGPRPQRIRVRIEAPRDNRYHRQGGRPAKGKQDR
ncbi:hypothetical protein [Microbulbifer thermotolerans]|uniref:Uncharacterized protein n=1 Tax=Microbulbifer thermotolerans TaxID=252514 RepID=A0AB35I0E8_MICTH|nr:hypothetical protein [Microbulbifer thermotolerans]MCX2780240.1 hypothetical protein [Microbulbifer thermotolerans]MCX2783864.1 hypothetical protein [Microbulbifer thermotolerans]MCX2795935.1 hypothetical protein [Microbulbifer thermotolerans]MCX2802616.1 hypothetical protein [Microbulbifer thermotolerans]MCX2805806.1 hypothetical protein [Microbulbifer thermotolerans]